MRIAIRRELDKSGPSYITDKYASGKQIPYKSGREEDQNRKERGVSVSESDRYMEETANALAELEREIFLGDYSHFKR
jgi:hypothetical protein